MWVYVRVSVCLSMLPKWRFATLKLSFGRTLRRCLKVGRAWIARRFPWWDELEAAPLLHEVELSWKSELDRHPFPLRGFVEKRNQKEAGQTFSSRGWRRKRMKRERPGLILAWWPHRSQGQEWPIVVETCIPGRFSHLWEWETEAFSRSKDMRP